ncbi:tetratricopeptide repeat protein [Candidatus Methylacidithermus pantelleriae]|uniref:Tetratricopeptide repeat protein n=1 Tax=Candidatus Methylacidithermus pantelleriae TaxID=2744239 RepID=A0A8J2BLR9_9BACT|nr:tetratricopeptide repeat protein [Candidatus Methylacidithermus pantelleriae]CAF0689520.1 hypothetical protein MPNT_10249 [Candidatus Methylacidithermus pantelleriae]
MRSGWIGRIFFLLGAVGCASVVWAATSPQDQFLQIYFSLQEAERLERKGELSTARAQYEDALKKLQALKHRYPEWEPSIVTFRYRYCQEKLRKLEERLAQGAQGNSPADNTGAGGGAASEPTPLTEEILTLRARVRHLEEELRDANARAAAAAAGQSSELPRLQAEVSQLHKELEETRGKLASSVAEASRLRRELEEQKAKASGDSRVVQELSNKVQQLEKDLAEARSKLASSQADAAQLRQELAAVKGGKPAPAGDSVLAHELKSRISDLEKELAETKGQLANALADASRLRGQLDATQKELAALQSGAEDRLAKLLEENRTLKAQLADAETKIKSLQSDHSGEVVLALKQELQRVHEQAELLERQNRQFQADTESLRSQLEMAQKRLLDSERQLVNAPNAESLRKENEILRSIINRQLQEQARREATKRLALEELARLKVQSQALEQHIEILASPLVQLSPEEVKLLREPRATSLSYEAPLPPKEAVGDAEEGKEGKVPGTPPVADSGSGSAASETSSSSGVAENTQSSQGSGGSAADLPQAGKRAAEEASALFAQGKYDQAEAIYRQLVHDYPNSLFAWSNLGVVLYQMRRYGEAEKALQEAIRLNPDDAFSYSVLGIVYYQMGRYDDAIATLTQAIVLDPNDAKTRNYLGIACTKKGWQEAAEKELRRAVELDPNYADAQFNLAVVYATEKPPARELARRHYQAALQLGLPKDPQLEKFLE